MAKYLTINNNGVKLHKTIIDGEFKIIIKVYDKTKIIDDKTIKDKHFKIALKMLLEKKGFNEITIKKLLNDKEILTSIERYLLYTS